MREAGGGGEDRCWVLGVGDAVGLNRGSVFCGVGVFPSACICCSDAEMYI